MMLDWVCKLYSLKGNMPTMTRAPTHRRHDISDRVWNILAPLLPGRRGSVGRPAQDNRRFINAVFRIIRTGAPWRDLPPDYGDWKNTHRRYSRWRDRGVWEDILEALIDEPDFEWLMLDASYVKVHAHGTGATAITSPVYGGKRTPKARSHTQSCGNGRYKGLSMHLIIVDGETRKVWT